MILASTKVWIILSNFKKHSDKECFFDIILERASGIEPPSSAWKADIITVIRYPQLKLYYKKTVRKSIIKADYFVSFSPKVKPSPETIITASTRNR